MVLTKKCGNASEIIAIYNNLQLILKQNVKKVWERRFQAFPPHYTSE